MVVWVARASRSARARRYRTPIFFARYIKLKRVRRWTNPGYGFIRKREVGRNHLRTSFGQCQRYRLTDTLTGAGDQGHASRVCSDRRFHVSPKSAFAGRLESCHPPSQVVDHGVGLLVQFGEALVYVPTLKVCPKRRNGNVNR